MLKSKREIRELLQFRNNLLLFIIYYLFIIFFKRKKEIFFLSNYSLYRVKSEDYLERLLPKDFFFFGIPSKGKCGSVRPHFDANSNGSRRKQNESYNGDRKYYDNIISERCKTKYICVVCDCCV